MLGVLGNGLMQMNVDSYVRDIITGLIIVVAVAASSLGRAREGWVAEILPIIPLSPEAGRARAFAA